MQDINNKELMNNYVRNLSINNGDSIESACEPCARIIYWLSEERQRKELSNVDIETLFKAMLYVRECFSIFDARLLLQLTTRYTQFDASIFNNYYEKCKCDAGADMIINDCLEYVLNAPNGCAHIAPLEKLLAAIAELQPSWQQAYAQLYAANETAALLGGAQRRVGSVVRQSTSGEPLGNAQLIEIVLRVFQLPAEQVELAVQRILRFVPFAVISSLFIHESGKNVLAHKYRIVAHLLCTRCTFEESAAHCFMQSIHNEVAANHDDSGLRRFIKCLANQRFARAFMLFVRSYLNEQYNSDSSCNSITAATVVPEHSILYLTLIALSLRSPCRTEFYDLLSSLACFRSVRAALSKIAYVYS